ncbi:asparagine synthase (glutamine-hydrolyzing) [Hanstruepera marina]|uniref:asparagine synthase (glutamine-hydrolyzing) n=1 Tax=Hanstruepera marina TaxID=2873265 RepID=UPI001CA64626|nr:asparagine synthase (glutamine-hydrolyzing) [Hanstruepera marina]
MCGFLVEYNCNSQIGINKSNFLNILALSNTRGPDSQNYWSNNVNIQMGFNRLAILDLSNAANQPMISKNNKFTIVFNGEIYNHLELRKKLSYNKFCTTSDTETITVCLEEWGILKTVKALNGMFALSIVNNKTNEVTLVRDFAGIKPLFYAWNGSTLVAASQYDQITSHPLFNSKSIDPSVLKLYLQQHFVPAPFGLYDNTYQVLPGEMITITQTGKKTHTRYWKLPTSLNYQIKDSQEAESYIATVLDSSVKSQLLSDVPLGAFLSGGVDSALICTALKNNQKNPKVFTIGSDSKVHDESKRAQKIAKALHLKQAIQHLTANDMMMYWDEAIAALHEPLADISILPTFLVSKLAKKEVTVALSGDGGDELFFGYERFWSIGKNIKYQHLPSLFKKAIYGVDKYTSGNQRVNAALLAKSQAAAHQGLHSRFRKEWLYKIAPDLQKEDIPEGYNVYNYSNSKDARALMSNIRHAEFYGMMQKTLRKVDLASMQNSLEVRVPFLDKEMIEASLKMDPLISFGGANRKKVLKGILHNRIPSIPNETVKKGFSIPLSSWIRKDLKTVFSERLLEGDAVKFGFEKKAIESMLQDHIQEKGDFKWPLFTLYALLK